MSDVADVNIEFWLPGADVSDPNQKPLDEVTTDSTGVGTTTSMILQTGQNYDIWFNGSSTYYDELIKDWTINYNPDTGKGFLIVSGKTYYPAVKVGTFVDVDSLAENHTSVVSAKTNVTNETVTVGAIGTWVSLTYDELYSEEGTTVYNSTGDLLIEDTDYSIDYPNGKIKPLTSVAANQDLKVSYTYAPDDTIAYDESVGTGSFWFKIDIGNADANSELWDVVMCFRDAGGVMEGDEVTSFTASYVSGSTTISIPGNLIGYWTDGMGAGGKRCIKIADKLGSAEKARWQFDITVNEANWEEGVEEFEMTFDDLGDYSKRSYPSKDLKATADEIIIISQA
jgi:hypothetical protein